VAAQKRRILCKRLSPDGAASWRFEDHTLSIALGRKEDLMDIDEIDAYRAGLLEMLAEVEKTLDARMANVGRMDNKDRHQDFIDGLRCADPGIA
jgi:hypothetical protein